MSQQPVPSVTAVDVERIARRDFPPGVVSEVLAILREYGTEDWEGEPVRVRLAVLRLAAGDLEHLRYEMDRAKRDYRDVLASAEYPGYAQCKVKELSPEDRKRIIDTDWRQYQQWLKQ